MMPDRSSTLQRAVSLELSSSSFFTIAEHETAASENTIVAELRTIHLLLLSTWVNKHQSGGSSGSSSSPSHLPTNPIDPLRQQRIVLTRMVPSLDGGVVYRVGVGCLYQA